MPPVVGGRPSLPSAERLALSLARRFFENGNYDAVGTSIDPHAMAQVLPATAEARCLDLEPYGFSGLSVQSVGYSAGIEDAEECVYVYVTRGSKKHLRELSGEKDGIGVKVINLGRLFIKPEAASAAAGKGNFYERNGRIACGSSCAPAGESYTGTFGALVTETNGMYALSNNHVFAGCNHIAVGQPILAPSTNDSHPAIRAPQQLCRHSRIVELRTGTPTLVPLVNADAALAEVPDDNVVSSWQGDDRDGYDTPANVAEPFAGLRVKKFGRTTGFTIGTIEAKINTPMPLPYKVRYFTAKVYFRDIWTVRATDSQYFALPGDSGSLVVTDDNSAAVGLLFATTQNGEYGYIAPISTVLSAFGNMTLVSGYNC